MDKINTNNDLDGVETQYQILKSNNQRETHVLDDIFIQRQQYDFSPNFKQRKSIKRCWIANRSRKGESRISDWAISKFKVLNGRI